jgi:uncharacterized membrane protein
VKAPGRTLLRGCGLAVAAVVYAVLAHLSNSQPSARGLGVVLAIGPLLLVPLLISWNSRFRLPCLLACALACWFVQRHWSFLAGQVSLIYLLQQGGAYAGVGALFARSLLPGQTPLCTHWAALVHGPLSPALLRYTRRVTAAWVVFFAMLTAALILLYALAPLGVWSAFANFCAFPLVIAMFVGEYLVRGRVLPDMRHAGIMAGARLYLRRT